MLRSTTALKALAQKGKQPISGLQCVQNLMLDNKQGVENLLVAIGVFPVFWAWGLRLF